MDKAIFQEYKEQDQKKARIATIIWAVIFFLILIYPWLTYQDPPPGQEGIFVNLGIPDVGDGDENGTAAAAEPAEEKPSESEPETSPQEEPEPEPEPEKEVKEEKPKPTTETKKVIEDNSKELALKKEKEKAKKAAEQKKKDAEQKAKAAAAAKKKAEEAAKKKAAEEAAKKKAELDAAKAEADKLKNELGGLFGDGGGQGNTGTPGNQGDPGGDPDSKVLEGISTGAGKVGSGLADRGGAGPTIQDNSQAFGTVVIWVCVDTDGQVLTSKYTQGKQGEISTTSDPRLIKLAEANAKKWKFKSGMLDKQCGTITYEFKPK